MNIKTLIEKIISLFRKSTFDRHMEERLKKKTISLTKPSEQMLRPVIKSINTSVFELTLKSFPSSLLAMGICMKQYRKLDLSSNAARSLCPILEFNPDKTVKSCEVMPSFQYKEIEGLYFCETKDNPAENCDAGMIKALSFLFSNALIKKIEYQIYSNLRNFDIVSSFKMSIQDGPVYINSPKIYSNLSIARSYPFVLKSRSISVFSRKEKASFFQKIHENQRLNKEEYKIIAIYSDVPLDSARNIQFSDDFKTLTIDLSYRVAANIRSSVLIIGREKKSREIFRQIIISS